MNVSSKQELDLPKWFDPQFFSQSYLTDRKAVSAIDSYRAFLAHQKDSIVFPSAAIYIESHLQELPDPLRPYVDRIMNSFDWQGYSSRNQDLAGLKPIDVVRHFLAYGLAEPRSWSTKAGLLDRRFAWTAQSGHHAHLDHNFQAVVHCYHFDVLCLLMPYLRNVARLGGAVHILVANDKISSLVMDGFLQGLSTGARRHSWRRVVNYGEDWSSFDQASKDGLFDEDGITIKMQTKKSSNLGKDGGLAWIDEALAPICGTYMAIERLLTQLSKDHYSVHASQLTKRSGFGANEELVAAFAVQLGLVADQQLRVLPFSGGSMFAARNQAIRQFFTALGPVDYLETHSSSPFCGRYAGHALERVFFYFCHFLYGPDSVTWSL